MAVFQVEDRDAPRIQITYGLRKWGLICFAAAAGGAGGPALGLAPAQLREVIGGYAALIIRSETRVTDDLLTAATRLQVIGHAGSGVDNIDLAAAGRRGVLVVHAPGGNVPAAAEHTMALLLALARHIPAASGSLKAGRWEKSRFVGVELCNKTLGILGRSAGKWPGSRQRSQCAWRPVTPYRSTEQAQRAGVRLLGKEEVLMQADFITLHAAITDGRAGTHPLVGAQELSLLKRGAPPW